MSQVEIQRQIERFTAKFIDDLTQAADALHKTDTDEQQRVLRRVLLYASSALDIASGPQPEMNVLDMLVFVTLSRRSLEGCWLADLMGDGGHGLIAVFAEFERHIWDISDDIMDGSQQHQLRELIRAWGVAHTDHARVEWVRFDDISIRDDSASHDHARTARGLLRSIQLAAQTADQALLLGERALFITRRLPAVLRLHARVGAHEMLNDVGHLSSVQAQLAANADLRPLDRVLKRCMSALGAALLGWLLPRPRRGGTLTVVGADGPSPKP